MKASANLHQMRKLSYEKLLDFVYEANKYESYILLESEAISINVKSLMAVSSLPFIKGEVLVKASGPDAQSAIEFAKARLGQEKQVG